MQFGNAAISDPRPFSAANQNTTPLIPAGTPYTYTTTQEETTSVYKNKNSPDVIPFQSMEFSPFPSFAGSEVGVAGESPFALSPQTVSEGKKRIQGSKKVPGHVVKSTTTTQSLTKPSSGNVFTNYWWLWLLLLLLLLWWLYKRFWSSSKTSATNVVSTKSTQPMTNLSTPPVMTSGGRTPPSGSTTTTATLPGTSIPPQPSTQPTGTPSTTPPVPVPGGGLAPTQPLLSGAVNVSNQTALSTQNEKPFGTLTGDVTTDTSNIFSVDDIVCLQSLNSNKFLRFVPVEQGLPNQNSAPEADLVLEATGTDCLHDVNCQWRVKPANTYKRAIRLENVGNPGEYLREFLRENPQQNLPVSGWQAGVGLYWSDIWATTRNFLDPQYTDTQSIVMIGAKVADMLNIKSLDKNSQWMLGARPDGTIIRPDRTLASELAVLWKVHVIGKYQSDGKIVYVS